MTLMGICDECKQHKRIHVPFERRLVTRGPDGRRLCSRHARVAWNEYDRVFEQMERVMV